MRGRCSSGWGLLRRCVCVSEFKSRASDSWTGADSHFGAWTHADSCLLDSLGCGRGRLCFLLLFTRIGAGRCERTRLCRVWDGYQPLVCTDEFCSADTLCALGSER
jgi:hypothetical protein